MPAELYGRYNPEQVACHPETLQKRVAYKIVSSYLRARHSFSASIHPETPTTGPTFAGSNHGSLLDVPALMIGDPYYPSNVPVIDREQFNNPVFKPVLNTWNAIPIDRDGKDSGAIRKLFGIFDDGGTACLALEGTRSRTGHLWPMDKAAVALTLRIANRGVTVCPIVVVGAYECLPPGVPWWKDKPGPVQVISGKPIDLSPWKGKRKLPDEELEDVAGVLQTSLANLLPEPYKPLPGTPKMWTSADYQPLRKMPAKTRDQHFNTFQESIVFEKTR